MTYKLQVAPLRRNYKCQQVVSLACEACRGKPENARCLAVLFVNHYSSLTKKSHVASEVTTHDLHFFRMETEKLLQKKCISYIFLIFLSFLPVPFFSPFFPFLYFFSLFSFIFFPFFSFFYFFFPFFYFFFLF